MLRADYLSVQHSNSVRANVLHVIELGIGESSSIFDVNRLVVKLRQ